MVDISFTCPVCEADKTVDEKEALTIIRDIAEQARADGELDCRSDIYALGATLYHLVTGEVPYDASTAMGILTKHITDPFPSPQERNPAVSDECAILLEIMMAKEPGDRPLDWGVMIAEIDRVLAGKIPETARPEIGQSQVMQVTASRALDKRKITNAPKKARKKKRNPSSAPTSADSLRVRNDRWVNSGRMYLLHYLICSAFV